MPTNPASQRLAQALRRAAEGRSTMWLSSQTGISPATLRRRLTSGHGLTVAEVEKITEALGVDMESILHAATASEPVAS